MCEEAAFLAAIAATPDDDTVRLVFADWLTERGSTGRAAFLRSECALASAVPGQAQWHEAFINYQNIWEGRPEEWRTAVSRHPMEHWLALSARSAWMRLENWCRQHHPRLLETLNPGASAAEIDAVEQAIGQPLPLDVRESFAIHNGSNEFIFGHEHLTTEEVVHDWQMWRAVEGHNEEFRSGMESFPESAIALDYANPGWVSLLRDAGCNHLGVDLAPGPVGTGGQVINFGKNEDRKCVLATGWAEFLADYAAFLESGVVKIDDPDSLVWGDRCCAALGNGHCHDVLRKRRREGRWPVPKPA